MPKFYKTDLLSNPSDAGDEAGPVRILLEWKAPARPFRKKDRSFYTTTVVLVVLVSMIAFFAGYYLFIGTIFALLFLVYVLSFVPPEDIDYKISTQGVTIGEHFYHWQELDAFWLSEKEGSKLLHIVTQLKFPSVLILVLGQTPEDTAKNTVARYLPFHEIAPKTFLDKWSESLQKHFPLENPHR